MLTDQLISGSFTIRLTFSLSFILNYREKMYKIWNVDPPCIQIILEPFDIEYGTLGRGSAIHFPVNVRAFC